MPILLSRDTDILNKRGRERSWLKGASAGRHAYQRPFVGLIISVILLFADSLKFSLKEQHSFFLRTAAPCVAKNYTQAHLLCDLYW